MDEDGIRRRIEEKLAELGKTARGASIEAGGSADLIRGLLRGRQRSFRGENLTRLASVLGVSVNWLLTGEHDHMPSEEIAASLDRGETRESNGSSTINAYQGNLQGSFPEIDARTGAGPGQVGEHEIVTTKQGDAYIGHRVVSEWVFPPQYLRHELRVRPGTIMMLEVVGDSMSPTLESGDRVLIDTSHSRPSPDGIYVIDEGDGPMVKRLQMIRRTNPLEIRIISDNPHHEPYTMRLDDVRVVGRVAARLTKT